MVDGRLVENLVEAARSGDAQAWDEMVDRYAPLVVAICRRFRLSQADLHDVSQIVWLRLVEQLSNLRAPRALPGWIVTTTRRECLRVVNQSRREEPLEAFHERNDDEDDISAALLQAERRSALREAFACLPVPQQQLMLLLIADPPIGYREISRRLGIPQGSIGPTRARTIERLRAAAPVAALSDDCPSTPQRPSNDQNPVCHERSMSR